MDLGVPRSSRGGGTTQTQGLSIDIALALLAREVAGERLVSRAASSKALSAPESMCCGAVTSPPGDQADGSRSSKRPGPAGSARGKGLVRDRAVPDPSARALRKATFGGWGIPRGSTRMTSQPGINRTENPAESADTIAAGSRTSDLTGREARRSAAVRRSNGSLTTRESTDCLGGADHTTRPVRPSSSADYYDALFRHVPISGVPR